LLPRCEQRIKTGKEKKNIRVYVRAQEDDIRVQEDDHLHT